MKQLTSEQRYTISVSLQNKIAKGKIAKMIGVDRSTLYRELKRNSTSNGEYHWSSAQKNADYKRKNKQKKKRIDEKIIAIVKDKLTTEQWSPEQISGRLAPQGIHISHETIYRIIRLDKRQGGTLYTHCRHRLKHRKRPVGGSIKHIPNRVSISERPKEANGKRKGDWEMDTIVGKGNNGAIVTLVERSTGLLIMRLLPYGKQPKELAQMVCEILAPFKGNVLTITTDNGLEFAQHEMISKKIGAAIYFADPYSSWQKGAIENANGLIRQYIPKSTDFSTLTQQQIIEYETKINNRPRERLGFKTPHECYYGQNK